MTSAMLKIDRKAFLALALGMSVGGCYVNTNPPPGPRPQMAPAQPQPPQGPQVAPQQECVGWTPTGECNEWEAMAAAPQDECIGWTPTGECNQWQPTQECVGWTPTGECNRWEPYHE
jgi:hypothetical protein